MSRTRAKMTEPYIKMSERIPGGFQRGQGKNPDGTQGPTWDMGRCGRDCFISPACLNCPVRLEKEGTKTGYDPGPLLDPLGWKKPQNVYIAPEGDLYHENIPDEFIYQVCAVAESCPQHMFSWYTKRHDRMASMMGSPSFPLRVYEAGRELLGDRYINRGSSWGDNLFIGVSVENQEYMDKRTPALLELPKCLNLVLLVAPMLEHVIVPRNVKKVVDWYICTGEFGEWCDPKPRPCKLEWQIDLANQVPGTPFYLSRKHHRVWVARWLEETGGRSHRDFPYKMTDEYKRI